MAPAGHSNKFQFVDRLSSVGGWTGVVTVMGVGAEAVVLTGFSFKDVFRDFVFASEVGVAADDVFGLVLTIGGTLPLGSAFFVPGMIDSS